MKTIFNRCWTEYLFLVLVIAASLFLFLANLGNQYLWQDEAQTALISKTILTNGLPLGCDGKNFFSQEAGAEYGENYVWKWHTWLPFYLLAAFFKLFGFSTFVARLPFAIFGIATVFIAYLFCRDLWKNKKMAMLAAGILLFSVPFLILSRQCRYYSLAAFFSLVSLYAYLAFLDKKKYAAVLFVLSLTLLFHTHYIYCVTLLVTVILHALFFCPRKIKTLLFLAAAVVLVNVPWIIWFWDIKYGQQYGSGMFEAGKLVIFTKNYLYQITRHIFSPYLLLVILVVAVVNRVKTGAIFPRDRLFWRNLSLLLFFIIFNLLMLIVAVPTTFFRYLAPLIPVFAILVAVLVLAAARLHFVLALGIVAGLLSTANFTDFLYEITHDYDGPIEGIVKYLNEHGSKDDVVLITYGDMPLKFYTNMKIVGGLTGEDLSDANDPDWIIVRKHSPPRIEKVIKHLEKIDISKYLPVVIDYPDIINENRENPQLHHFRTVVDEDRVRIYRRIK